MDRLLHYLVSNAPVLSLPLCWQRSGGRKKPSCGSPTSHSSLALFGLWIEIDQFLFRLELNVSNSNSSGIENFSSRHWFGFWLLHWLCNCRFVSDNMVALQVKRLSEGYKQMEEAVQDLPYLHQYVPRCSNAEPAAWILCEALMQTRKEMKRVENSAIMTIGKMFCYTLDLCNLHREDARLNWSKLLFAEFSNPALAIGDTLAHCFRSNLKVLCRPKVRFRRRSQLWPGKPVGQVLCFAFGWQGSSGFLCCLLSWCQFACPKKGETHGRLFSWLFCPWWRRAHLSGIAGGLGQITASFM